MSPLLGILGIGYSLYYVFTSPSAGFTGFLDYPNNINECYDKKNQIYDDITYLFQNMEKDEYDYSHNADKSGKSIASVSEFRNDNFVIKVVCTDWAEQMGYMDTLKISIEKTDFLNWIKNYAYK